MNIKRLACLLALAAAALALGCSNSQIAATVNGQAILEEDVTAYVDAFRTYSGYTSDEDWASYLAEAGLTAEDMRTAAINSLAQRVVYEEAAAAAGVEITSEALAAAVQTAKNSLGYGEMDDEKWESYKALFGYTDEQFEDQVYLTELQEALCNAALEAPEVGGDEVFEYIQANAEYIYGKESVYLSSTSYQFCYAALSYLEQLDPSERREAMQQIAAINSLDVADDAQLSTLLDLLDGSEVEMESGWECLSSWADWYTEALEEINAGGLCTSVQNDGSGNYFVIFVVDEYAGQSSYEDLAEAKEAIPATLYDALVTATETAAWSTACSEYLISLTDSMDLQINAMPDGLSYAV